MELTNVMYKVKQQVSAGEKQSLAVLKQGLETIVVLLNPFVPHLTEDIWAGLRKTESLVDHPWLTFSEEAAAEEKVTIAVQVNGKVRSLIEAPADISREDMEQSALNDDKIRKWTEGKTVRKVVVVPGKLVNIVVS